MRILVITAVVAAVGRSAHTDDEAVPACGDGSRSSGLWVILIAALPLTPVRAAGC